MFWTVNSSYILWLYFSFSQVQSKLDLSDYRIRECLIMLLSHVTHDICLHHIEVISLQGIIYFGDKSNVIRPSHTWNTSEFGLCIWIREIMHVPKTELPTLRDIVLGALDSYSV